jgi:acyl-CoA synthetase (AMP-forming)/AMP-acid ligase II
VAPPVPTTTRPARAFGRDSAHPPNRVDPAPTTESLGALVSRQAATLGDRIYAEDARSERALSFAALEQWRCAVAAGVFTPGTTVAVSIADPLSCAAAVLGAVAAGLWVAPLDPAIPEQGPSGLDTVLARTGAHAVLADRPAAASCPLDWIEFDELAPAAGVGAAAAPVGAQGGVVLSSSGTTGPPKVVRLGQSRLLHTARCVVAHHDLTADDRCFNSLPLFHINAEVVALLSSLLAGSCLVLDERFHRTGFWDLIAERRVTWINAVPAIISRLADLRSDENVPAGVRFIRSASAPLPVATADRFEERTGIPVVETYGMTEAGSQITAHPLSVPRRAGSVGVPVGVELRIVTEESAETTPAACGPAEVGQVEIRGPSVIDAYAGGEHGDRFRPGGWLRTGDLGWRDADGFVYLVARSDDVINRSGEKVFPREIEEVISADPSVVAVAVCGQSDPELGQVPVAFVVLDGVESAADARDARATIERLNDTLGCALVRTRRPVTLHVVSSLPRGATGKVRRGALFDGDTPILQSFAGG